MFRVIKLTSLAFVLIAPIPLAKAQTVVAGGTGTPNAYPFGNFPAGQYAAGSQYQQIYSSADFSGPVTITGIAFASASTSTPGTNVYNFNIGLGTTSSTPANPSSTFASNGTTTQVFSGPLTAPLTATGNFDLTIPLTTPFSYNPSQGNLLLDVVLNSNTTGTTTYFVSGNANDVGRVYQASGIGAATAAGDSGLETEFVVIAVPEPSTSGSIAMGSMLLLASWWKKQRAKGQGQSGAKTHTLRS
jgi:hypothetical protein